MRTVELTEDEAKDTAYLGLLTAKKVKRNDQSSSSTSSNDHDADIITTPTTTPNRENTMRMRDEGGALTSLH